MAFTRNGNLFLTLVCLIRIYSIYSFAGHLIYIRYLCEEVLDRLLQKQEAFADFFELF